MATRKCGNIYFRKYFMAVRKFTNIFVLLLTLLALDYSPSDRPDCHKNSLRFTKIKFLEKK